MASEASHPIADGLITQKIAPQLQDGAQRLKSLKDQYSSPELKPLNEKLKNIESWSKKANLLLPFVSKFLGSNESKNETKIY